MTHYLSTDGVISQKKIPGSKKLTDAEYQQALEAKLRGESPVLRGEGMRILKREKRTVFAADGARLEIPANDDMPDGFTEMPPPPTEAEQRELDRLAAKRTRDQALQAITHEWPDGSIVQVRPQDLANFQVAIQRGESQRWVLTDNTTRLTTATELESALADGIAQAEVIWSSYADALDALNSD